MVNYIANFGNEYVWHCHILAHEENDMMRPLVMFGMAPSGVGYDAFVGLMRTSDRKITVS